MKGFRCNAVLVSFVPPPLFAAISSNFCGQEHQCPKMCESPGYCEVKTEILNKKEIFKGQRGDFEYERVSEQTGIRKSCCKVIPAGALEHEGLHCHSSDPRVRHFCDVRCPSCEYICTNPHAHDGLHDTSHGNMKVTHFVSESKEIDLRGRKYVWGESGTAEMCMMYCKAQGRGHIHIATCGSVSGGACAASLHDGARHETCKYGPDVDIPKDELTHKAFWARNRFKDPCTKDEQAQFELCSHFCSSKEHKTVAHSTGVLLDQKVHCTEKIWHAPLAASHGGGGYVSSDGHKFPCSHVSRSGHHVIFLIDTSGSMGSWDARPQTREFQSQPNRLGAIYESIVRFVRTRTTGSVNVDAMSLILFTTSITVPFEGQDMAEHVVARALSHGPGGNEDYCLALEESKSIIRRSAAVPALAGKPPVLIFLSDGANTSPGDPEAICREMKRELPKVVIHTVAFGRDFGSHELLKKMAAAAGGTFAVSLDEVQLARTFEALAKSLRPAVSALL